MYDYGLQGHENTLPSTGPSHVTRVIFFPGTVDRDAQGSSRWLNVSAAIVKAANAWRTAPRDAKPVRLELVRRVRKPQEWEVRAEEERTEATKWWANGSSTVVVGGLDAAKPGGVTHPYVCAAVITPVLVVALLLSIGGRRRQAGRARYGEMRIL